MKYFRPDLWEKINSENEKERHEAESEWERNDKTYWEVFQKSKQYLPEDFLSNYQKSNYFHDYLISGLEITKRREDNGGAVSIELKISNGPQHWLIQYGNVTSFHFDFIAEEELSFFAGTDSNAWDEWGYDEFSFTDQEAKRHEILFSSGRTITINFETILIKGLN